MAWTTPRCWTTGEVVTAAIMTTHVRDNFNVTAPAVLTTAGDILYASGSNVPARVAKGTNGNILHQASCAPAWTASPSFTGLTLSGALDVNGTIDYDGTDVDVLSSGDIDLVSSSNAAAAIYIAQSTGTSGTVKIHADTGTSVTEGAESINILSDVGGIGLRSTANLVNAINLTSDGGTTGTITLFNDQGSSVTEGAASIELLSDAGGVELRSTANLVNAINLTVDGGTTSTMTLFNDQGTTSTEGAASIQILSDVGGIGIKSGLNAAGAIRLTADAGTSETIILHADQGSGAASICLTSDAGGITLNPAGSVTMGGDINLCGNNIDCGGVIFLKEQACADADVGGSGQIWVDTATPNALFFTDDAGTDFNLSLRATTAISGPVELATAAETTTGSSAVLAVTPDGLAGSVVFGTRYVQMVIFDFTTDIAEGNGKFYLHIPAGLNGMDLVEVHAKVITVGDGSTVSVQVHNLTDTTDMLSTNVTIDDGELDSKDAAAAVAIDTGEDDVVTNDVLRIDVDGNGGDTTVAKGLIVTLGFRLP